MRLTFGAWLNTHAVDYEGRPPAWVAVDPRTGSVIMDEPDPRRFEEEVQRRAEETGEPVWTFHTSLLDPRACRKGK